MIKLLFTFVCIFLSDISTSHLTLSDAHATEPASVMLAQSVASVEVQHNNVSPQADAPNIWTFTVVAAIVTTLGTILGYVLKEVFIARSFEKWKSRRESESVYRKYRDPIVLASVELANRLHEIIEEYPTDFLVSELLEGTAPLPTHGSGRDVYFRRYKCQGTAYRLAALLAWLELYRQEIVFLDPGESNINLKLEINLQKIRRDLADGHLNNSKDWIQWADALVFREEQRAIGETLITQEGDRRLVISYGAFVNLLEDRNNNKERRWLLVVTNFFLDPKPPKDFRRIRYCRLLVHLVDLIKEIEPRLLTNRLTESYSKCENEIKKISSDKVAS